MLICLVICSFQSSEIAKEATMPTKPMVIYFEEDDDRLSGNFARDALAFVIKNDCHCDVLQCENSYRCEDVLPVIEGAISQKRAILVIAKQEKYIDDHLNIIKLFRQTFSSEVPIVIIPEYGEERFVPTPDDHGIYIYNHTDPELIDFIQTLKKDFSPNLDWFDIETDEEKLMLTDYLSKVYVRNYFENDDDRNLGLPDYNGQIVAEVLRLRLLPPELIKTEFDDVLRRPKIFKKVLPEIYNNELKRMRGMNQEEKDQFTYKLMRAKGYYQMDGGRQKRDISFGENLSAYAIDPVTLVSTTTFGFGAHKYAIEKLHYEVMYIQDLRKRISPTEWEEDEITDRIIFGLILENLDGFATPFLSIFEGGYNEKELKRAINFVISEGKYIPVTFYGSLIEG